MPTSWETRTRARRRPTVLQHFDTIEKALSRGCITTNCMDEMIAAGNAAEARIAARNDAKVKFIPRRRS